MQKILRIAGDNEKQMCYEVLMLYGPSRVETIKMTQRTLLRKHPLGKWLLQHQAVSREGEVSIH